jgi:hypothetical protein
MNIRKILKKIPAFRYYHRGKEFINSSTYKNTAELHKKELLKNPSRTDVINYLLENIGGNTSYLEIGVRNPEDNFNLINASEKYSVDPGIEFDRNPVDFQMKSDDFFNSLSKNEVLNAQIKFDIIFIDGLHLADQVDRDITNCLRHIKDSGFILLHDCNPPTEWHARETYEFYHTPAYGSWNGSVWKAFLKWRSNTSVYSCCIDTDWGLGVISKNVNIGNSIVNDNSFYEFLKLEENRGYYLNLVDFNQFKSTLVANN